MTRIIILVLISFIITSGFGIIQGLKLEENSIYVIDQNNRYCTGCNCAEPIMLFEGFYIAQSFTPNYNVLSKILILITRTGSPSPMNFTLYLRGSLDGENLISIKKETTGTEMEFDFESINVVAGNQYYMIITIDDISTPANGYGVYKTIYDSYIPGKFFTKVNQAEWKETTRTDLLFVTYWKDYCPDEPTIKGPSEGKAQERYGYIVYTDDPDGHEIKYQIDWGDGIISNWYGPYESDEEVEIAHQWAYENKYLIRVKAKDIYGAESGWSSIEVTMPKTKTLNFLLYQFLEKHPFIYMVIQKILEIT